MTGRNVDEAIENGLKELHVEKSKVEIEVIEQGSKGLFGIGAKPAKVKVTLKFNYELTAKAFLRDVLNEMGIKCEIHIMENEDSLKINLVGPDMGLLIGYRGETLDALQYLVSLVINKGNKEAEYKRVILDTEN
jgi:spoIIIJ-associated protein